MQFIPKNKYVLDVLNVRAWLEHKKAVLIYVLS